VTTFAEADPFQRRPGYRIDPVALDAPDIVQRLTALRPELREQWSVIGPDEYARAFMVAGLVKQDMIETVHDALIEAYQNKTGGEAFADLLTPVLREQGFLGGSTAKIGERLQLVFDTNLSVAQGAGSWRRSQRVKAVLPFLRYQAVLDGRVRRTHAAMHGVIRPVDDPVWDRWYPPCGFRCRCIARGVTNGQLARFGGITETLPNVQPDRGWGFNPGRLPMNGALAAVDRGNGDRLDGTPPVDPTSATIRGARRWLAVQSVVTALASLFPTQE